MALVPMYYERPYMGNYYYDDCDFYGPVNRMEREQRYMSAMTPPMRPIRSSMRPVMRHTMRPSHLPDHHTMDHSMDRTMDRFVDQTGDWELIPYSSPSQQSTISHRLSPAVWNDDTALSTTMKSFDHQVSDMSTQMRRMFEHMNRLLPVPILPKNNWENLKLENPIVSDGTQKKMNVQFDVRNFKPEEIQVKCSENLVQVHAKHEEKDGDRSVYREYMRSFTLPQGVRHEALKSKLSHEGILTVEAPCVSSTPAITADREIPVTFDRKMIK